MTTRPNQVVSMRAHKGELTLDVRIDGKDGTVSFPGPDLNWLKRFVQTAIAQRKQTAPLVRKTLRIQSTAYEESGAGWIERYFLRNKRGHYRELKKVPGNGQYAPDVLEILTWFVRLGVTHVEVVEGWHESVPAKTYPLKIFARHMRRISEEK